MKVIKILILMQTINKNFKDGAVLKKMNLFKNRFLQIIRNCQIKWESIQIKFIHCLRLAGFKRICPRNLSLFQRLRSAQMNLEILIPIPKYQKNQSRLRILNLRIQTQF